MINMDPSSSCPSSSSNTNTRKRPSSSLAASPAECVARLSSSSSNSSSTSISPPDCVTKRRVLDKMNNMITGAASWILPPQDKGEKGKMTVVLDIDETLIHTTKSQEPVQILDTFSINVFGERFTVLKRPSLDVFLAKAASKYELISYTAGVEEYSKAILQEIDPQGQYFKHCLFRQHCAQVSANSIVKDLRILNRCPTRVVLVDNTLGNFVLQPENGVPITTFVDDAADNALNVLLDFLACLERSGPDVRVPLRATFQLHELFKMKAPPPAPLTVPGNATADNLTAAMTAASRE